ILIMEFIGKDGRPAPTLKNLIFSSEQMLEDVWNQVIELISKLYTDCDMIHGDLSEYNLLWHESKIFCIDVSQSVRSTHPQAFSLLYRDICNICKVSVQLESIVP